MTTSWPTIKTAATTNLDASSALVPADVVSKSTTGGAYRVTRIDGTREVRARIALAANDCTATVFQSEPWLAAIGRGLARDGCGELVALDIADASNGERVALLPLTIARERRRTVARFADLDVSDYRGPLLGPAAPQDKAGERALWAAVKRGLPGVDLIRFEAMPAEIGGRPNPLARRHDATPARLKGLSVRIETTVEAMLRDRGKKYRKEAERCFRLLAKEGAPKFRRAETPGEINRAYAVLEAQQSARQMAIGHAYVLDQPQYYEFYRDLLITERESGFAAIFTLEAGPEVVAALMGVVRDDTFTLLRISNGGEKWQHLSPGRLIVIEAMRHFVERGIRTFDMGAGDYPFKRGFGAVEIELFDLVAACSLRGLPTIAVERSKTFVRQRPVLMAAIGRLRGKA